MKIKDVIPNSPFPSVFGALVQVLTIATLYGAGAEQLTLSVKDYGALGDGRTDDAVAIQKAVDAAGAAGGGMVLIPASDQPYLVTRAIKVTHSNIELRGKGATLKLADNAVTGSSSHVLHVTGSSQQKIERVTIRGLSLDGGKSWLEIARRRSKSAAARDRWGGTWKDMTEHVKGLKEFLFKVTFKNGGGILRHVTIDAKTE